MPAYVIVMMTVNDPETYSKYTAQTPAIVKKYGGKFLTRGEAVTTLEGVPYEGRMVIVEFPNKADVEAFYADPDYQKAKKFRQAASELHAMLVQEGGGNTSNPDPKL